MDVLETARKDWKKTFPSYQGSVATMGWISNSGKNAYQWGGACHAGLTYPTISGKDLVAVFSGIHHHSNKEAERTFIEWLLFHSPFKNAFLKDTTVDALDHRVLMGDPDKPANYMSAGLMATRIFNEHPNSLSMWWEFVKRGLHPSIAFVFAHRMYVNTSGKILEHIPGHTGCFTGHLAIGSYRTAGAGVASGEGYILNFLRGITTAEAKPYRTGYRYALETFKLWTKDNPDGKGLKLLDAVPDLLKRAAGSKVEIKNPFAKAKLDYSGTIAPKLDDAMELLIPHLSKYKELF